MRRKIRNNRATTLGVGVILVCIGVFIWVRSTHEKMYTAADFNIETMHSAVDYNNNGVDDYTDILKGAKKDAKNHPTYDGTYQAGGFPPDDVGVCSDVVWRALKNAGYNLREMVDLDIRIRPQAYPKIDVRDKNIDFRRVVNLRVFFDTYAISLTLDPTAIEEWQPGDIVIFGADKHIGIISDRRNENGLAYVIHNSGQPNREEDFLLESEITGHYRFDASLIDPSILIPWDNTIR